MDAPSVLGEWRPLSEKQLLVCRALVERTGSVKQVAFEIGMHVKTFGTHTNIVYQKLGVHSRAQLIEKIRAHPKVEVIQVDVPIFLRMLDAKITHMDSTLASIQRFLQKENQ